MQYLDDLGQRAKKASRELLKLTQEQKNNALITISKELIENSDKLLKANEIDIQNAIEKGTPDSLIDRLKLNKERIEQIATSLCQISTLPDPVGEVISMAKRPNGLLIGQKRVPLGVVGIIYESRPNVTCDAFALCFKTSNAVILRGGSDAINSNIQIVSVIKNGLKKASVTQDAILLIEKTDRSVVNDFMKMNKYLDVLIPRGGHSLIKTVVENSTVPVIETGTGNCHIFVDETADMEMALNIIDNAKTQRMGVCNACESLVIHKSIAKKFLPLLQKMFSSKNVEIRGCEKSLEIIPQIKAANQEDWATEYLDAIISCKIVDSVDEAIEHINTYNTGHSESIITNCYENSQKFLEEIDAAAVYVNASTRFTDGFEFGFGAEIGISTQKLHARGPMGLLSLTTTKNIIYGNGQIRK